MRKILIFLFLLCSIVGFSQFNSPYYHKVITDTVWLKKSSDSLWQIKLNRTRDTLWLNGRPFLGGEGGGGGGSDSTWQDHYPLSSQTSKRDTVTAKVYNTNHITIDASGQPTSGLDVSATNLGYLVNLNLIYGTTLFSSVRNGYGAYFLADSGVGFFAYSRTGLSGAFFGPMIYKPKYINIYRRPYYVYANLGDTIINYPISALSADTIVYDTNGIDLSCKGLVIYATSDSTKWQHQNEYDSAGNIIGCKWVDISTAPTYAPLNDTSLWKIVQHRIVPKVNDSVVIGGKQNYNVLNVIGNTNLWSDSIPTLNTFSCSNTALTATTCTGLAIDAQGPVKLENCVFGGKEMVMIDSSGILHKQPTPLIWDTSGHFFHGDSTIFLNGLTVTNGNLTANALILANAEFTSHGAVTMWGLQQSIPTDSILGIQGGEVYELPYPTGADTSLLKHKADSIAKSGYATQWDISQIGNYWKKTPTYLTPLDSLNKGLSIKKFITVRDSSETLITSTLIGHAGWDAISGIDSSVNGGTAVGGRSVNGQGVTGNSEKFYGVYGSTSSTISNISGVYGSSNHTGTFGVRGVGNNGIGGEFETHSIFNASPYPILELYDFTTGTSQSGIGGIIDFEIQDDVGNIAESGQIISTLTNVHSGHQSSSFQLITSRDGNLIPVMSIDSSGILKLNNDNPSATVADSALQRNKTTGKLEMRPLPAGTTYTGTTPINVSGSTISFNSDTSASLARRKDTATLFASKSNMATYTADRFQTILGFTPENITNKSNVTGTSTVKYATQKLVKTYADSIKTTIPAPTTYTATLPVVVTGTVISLNTDSLHALARRKDTVNFIVSKPYLATYVANRFQPIGTYGSVTNIGIGYGLSSTQSPLTTTGTMKVDSTVLWSTVRAGHISSYPTLNQSTTGQAGSVANALTNGYGLSTFSYTGASGVSPKVDTTAIETKTLATSQLAAKWNKVDTISYHNLNAFVNLANSAGALMNDGSGNLSYGTPWTGMGYLTAITGTQLDNVWTNNGILTRTGANTYSYTANNSATWNALVTFPGFGTTSALACVGNDSRLSDTRNIAGGTVGAVPYQSAANTTGVVAATATANKPLMSGANAIPTWSTPTYPNAAPAAGTLIRGDGTNFATSTITIPNSFNTGDVVVATGSNVLGVVAVQATANKALFAGASAAPTWSAYTFPSTVATGNILIATSSSVVGATSALPSATTATTQALADNSTKIATTAYDQLYFQPLYATPTALTPSASITWTPVIGKNIYTLTPNATGNIAMGTIPSGCVGSEVVLIITTSGGSSYTITFTTNLKSQGTLATGTSTGMTFAIHFLIYSTSSVIELGRTTAM